jgi:hypothetical protein
MEFVALVIYMIFWWVAFIFVWVAVPGAILGVIVGGLVLLAGVDTDFPGIPETPTVATRLFGALAMLFGIALAYFYLHDYLWLGVLRAVAG